MPLGGNGRAEGGSFIPLDGASLCQAAVSVGCMVAGAGPGSDLSEASGAGFQLAALDEAAPACPPGPAPTSGRVAPTVVGRRRRKGVV